MSPYRLLFLICALILSPSLWPLKGQVWCKHWVSQKSSPLIFKTFFTLCNLPPLLPVLLPQSNEWQIHSIGWNFKHIPVTHPTPPTHPGWCWLTVGYGCGSPSSNYEIMMLWSLSASPLLSVQSLIFPHQMVVVFLFASILIFPFYDLLASFSP